MDDRVYHLCHREKLVCFGKATGLSIVVAYLFYQHWFGLLLLPVFYFFFRSRAIREGQALRQENLATQFLDALRTVSASLLAGYSMENAWREASREVENLYGKEAILLRELDEINHSVALNLPIEKLLDQFADRSGNADIMSFAEVFAFAKRSGGNFASIIEDTTEHMRARHDTEREIQILVASRKLEQRVMNVVPLFILAYLKLTSGDFLASLYGNLFGVFFMTGCLVAYGITIFLADRILDIQM